MIDRINSQNNTVHDTNENHNKAEFSNNYVPQNLITLNNNNSLDKDEYINLKEQESKKLLKGNFKGLTLTEGFVKSNYEDNFDNNNFSNNSIDKSYDSDEIKPDIFYNVKLQGLSNTTIYPLQTGSFYSTLFFLIFSTLGSGIIILPITMKNLGIVPASVLFTLAALISYFTLSQLVNEAYVNNTYYFSDLVKMKYGKRVLIFVEICFHVGNLLGVTVFNKVSK
jgi:hypothetical protein